MVGNGPITAVENHQSGGERFISWFVLRYSFFYGLRRFETHSLNALITADCFRCQLGFLLLSSCFVKLVNSNRVNCVKHRVLCKLFDPQTTAMSSCGNFTIIGDAHGNVDMFNIQSGIHRGSLGEPKGLFDTPFIHHIAREETALQWLAHGSRGLGWRAGRVIVQCS